jgi:hypothetical protein
MSYVVGQFLGGCLALDLVTMLDSGTCRRVREVRCVAGGGVVVDTVLQGCPGPHLGAVVGSWDGPVVTVLGFVEDDGVVVLVEALWAAAMRGRQSMWLHDPVGQPLVWGTSMFMVGLCCC